MSKPLSVGFFGQINFPELYKRIVVSPQKASTDMLAKNAAVFVWRVKMFKNALWQISVSCVRANPDDSIAAMRGFTIFKKKIDAVRWHECGIITDFHAREIPHHLMKQRTFFAHFI
ncbi:MAG: hypothetical protein PHS57_10765 [Alphaproteobacteria bacterium]|nr:hypothetical protein [Alphaproteobacteria bacterium]